MGHEITPDEDFASLDIGRVVHQIYYKDFRKEIALEGVKFDFFYSVFLHRLLKTLNQSLLLGGSRLRIEPH